MCQQRERRRRLFFFIFYFEKKSSSPHRAPSGPYRDGRAEWVCVIRSAETRKTNGSSFPRTKPPPPPHITSTIFFFFVFPFSTIKCHRTHKRSVKSTRVGRRLTARDLIADSIEFRYLYSVLFLDISSFFSFFTPSDIAFSAAKKQETKVNKS